MNSNARRSVVLAILFLFSISLMAQTGDRRQVSRVFATLTKSLESKSATVGQELALKTIGDVVVNGEVVIPTGSRLLGHVTRAVTRGKEEPQSVLEIVMDKAVIKGGEEIPLQAIIVAVAAPRDGSLSSDPTYGMMRSNEPKMVGVRPSSSSSSGELSASSKVASTAAVATAELRGRMDEPPRLNENSQGALGYEGLSISWHLMAPPPLTVFASDGKNVKLEAGTQMLLRMAAPRLAR